jgi:MoaA/NifB/PqqE/SkfB family radical SAM enzyme
MCDIWKTDTRQEISREQLERWLPDFEKLKVRWVVLSGGEPLMHSDLFGLCALLRQKRIRITLLTSGLLLERFAQKVVTWIDDVIVSIDGPPEVHDHIRGTPGGFAKITHGVQAIRSLMPVSARTTVQRENHQYLVETAGAVRDLRMRSISFLAADLTSDAFNRPDHWDAARQSEISLTADQIPVLDRQLEQVKQEFADFVLESPAKLQRIGHHFRAHLGQCQPVAPVCNAPWLSAVIESDGTMRTCFFHQSIGRISNGDFLKVLNGPQAAAFRSGLDVASNPVCQRCVCSLRAANAA